MYQFLYTLLLAFIYIELIIFLDDDLVLGNTRRNQPG